ncbi:MAG: YcaO-like family protein [Candidatus Yanofskybacteria bacterium]|nr:YcaO-like family protein [Candidatus Yanofskybacteria bacterium]
MRVQLGENWHARPTQEGLELMALERNIALELSDLTFRDQLIAVLGGEEDVPAENNAFQETLRQLERAGALSFVEQGPVSEKQPVGGARNVVDGIRRELVGLRGPVSEVYWLDPKQSRLSLSRTHLFTARYKEGIGEMDAWAGGSDVNWEMAELKAIMEALERYASSVVPRAELVEATPRELGAQMIDPKRVVAYSEAQYRNEFPLCPFGSNKKYWWGKVTLAGSSEERFLPAECLYYPLPEELAPNRYTFANSSGVAAGLTWEDAFARGLCESIERDAFMLVWFARLSMPRIDSHTVPEEQRVRVDMLESLGYRVYLVDMILSPAPTILAIAVSEKERPSLVLGAAANFNKELAVAKALSELEHQLYWEWRNPGNVYIITDQEEVRGVLDHMALYASPKHLDKASFLWKGGLIPFSENPEDEKLTLQIVIERLGKEGIREIATADLTPQHLKEAGVSVVRAIPLGLVPISFGYGMEPLGMPRYRKVAGQSSWWSEGHPFTHPFA